MTQFIYTTKVYYSDTDSAGVVYHTNYLKYMEHARMEWFFTHGCNMRDWHDKGVCFAVRLAQLDYLKPARLLDELQITCDIIKAGKASLEIKHIVRNAQDNDLTYCQGVIKLACVNDKLRPQKISGELLQQLQQGNIL